MKRSEPQSLGAIIDQYLTRAGAKPRLGEAEAVALWPQVVGDAVAAQTVDAVMREGRLIVTVDSAPLRQELALSRRRLIYELNRRLGADIVRDIVIR